ncbi:MAG: mannose-6-phosphate isomerase [Actinobacteria bacterium]|nr:mannose-6-phosphate isomerase [Actinomycetota bacterium]|tara:strand:+ start:404 stop:763 length:360 start_codon:yes stop_codon:yes gene_type:complete
MKQQINEIRDNRPWGYYDVLLDTPICKVKHIIVNGKQRLSYQYHEQREEYWTIIKGHAIVTLNDKTIQLKDGDQIHIPQKAKHRIENPNQTPLQFIEIQRGSYFGEDDIVRLEDDYNRN